MGHFCHPTSTIADLTLHSITVLDLTGLMRRWSGFGRKAYVQRRHQHQHRTAPRAKTTCTFYLCCLWFGAWSCHVNREINSLFCCLSYSRSHLIAPKRQIGCICSCWRDNLVIVLVVYLTNKHSTLFFVCEYWVVILFIEWYIRVYLDVPLS